MNNIFYPSTKSVVGVEVTPLYFSNNLPIINLYIYMHMNVSKSVVNNFIELYKISENIVNIKLLDR